MLTPNLIEDENYMKLDSVLDEFTAVLPQKISVVNW